MHICNQQATTFVNSITEQIFFATGNVKKVFSSLIYLIAVLSITSALTSKPLLAATRNVEKDYKINYTSNHSSSAMIFQVRFTAEDGKLKISGKVKRKNREKPVRLGHIDVSFLDEKGDVLMVKSVVYIPRKIHKLLRKASKFSVEFSKIAPKGSKINILYHKDSIVEPIEIEHNTDK